MKKQDKKTKSTQKATKKSETKEKKEVHRCDECKWYDVSTQRDFFRRVGKHDESGQRTTIKEIRAVCRSPSSKARGHLVKNNSSRRCFQRGTYVPPEKPGKVKRSKKEAKGTKIETSLPKRWSNPVKKNTVTLKKRLNGETKTFEKKGRRIEVTKATG